MKKHLLLLMGIMAMFSLNAQEEARLLRFPAIHGNQVVFTYAGDLYTVATSGGMARKLTNHDGYEMFARFSPDGKTIAFTGQYDGNTEVYVMPSQGGSPKRITYTATLGRDDVADRMGPNNIVFGWKPDGKTILFRSRRISYNDFNGQLFAVNIDGSLPEQLPVPRSGFCSFSPDGQKMAYNRIFREFRTWKRYRGGMADDVWIYDFKTNKIENITNNKAQDIIPMWHGNKIFYISDNGPEKRFNLYSYDLNSKETKKLSDYKDFDIKFPSLGDAAIVYEKGGYLYKFDIASEKHEKINITIAEDFAGSRPKIQKVGGEISNFEISPDGKRALFGAHGEIFTVPEKHGITRNLTNSSGIHERNSKWSPNGKYISYISDKTGEDEIYIQTQDGSLPPVQITSGSSNYKYQPVWSPDSKKIMWSDRNQKLHYVDIDTKVVTEIDYDPYGEFGDNEWSPDSKWIVYGKRNENRFAQVYLYSTEQKKSFVVTDNWYNSGNPVFSSDGKYLFFISTRDFNPTYSWIEWNVSYSDMGGIYFVTLNKETPSLFALKSDEVMESKAEAPATEEKDKKKDTKPEVKPVVAKSIDIDGIQARIGKLPLQASNYFNLKSVDNKLFYQRRGRMDERPVLLVYNFDDRKETSLGNVNGYEISFDRKKMLVSQNNAYGIISLPSAEIKLSDRLDLSGMEMVVNKQEEWKQIFNESWRQMRDFFYAPNMHGLDWKAEKERYAPLLKHVNHRNDLTYVIGEMISELNVGHAYVGGGQRPEVEKIKMGLLGAEISKDKASGYFKIDKILKGQNWTRNNKSPLTEIGVNASNGDFIIEIDGQSTKNMLNLYEALVNKAGKQVKLTLNSKPSDQGKRLVTVVPIDDESGLYYLQWVEANIEKVNKATNGRVGYIHIPDMGPAGLNEFVKYYYPQLVKEALIIDVRGNGGGNVSPIIIERLRREAAQITIMRNGKPNFEPENNGPMVMLCDEFSASDGDIVNYRFRTHKLGTIIGKRTWGGVVGIRGSLPFVDGGNLSKPEFSRYDLQGKEWIMEGVGVEPDIFVDNDPYLEFTGTDQQLIKGIEVIMEELKTKSKKMPDPPAFPIK
jgi:tricorn protease